MSKDRSAGIDTMIYNSYGKIAAILQSDTLPDIRFIYDAGQHRVAKVMAYPGDTIVQYYARDAEGQELVFYNRAGDSLEVDEYLIYGDGRLGAVEVENIKNKSKTLGYGNYYVSNHLGSVSIQVSDLSNQNIGRRGQDYFPFGVRIGNLIDSRYGFSSLEKDNENIYTTSFRQYDPNIGLWTSIDPLLRKYPEISTYAGFNLNPLIFVDPNGSEFWIIIPLEETKDHNTSIWELLSKERTKYDLSGTLDQPELKKGGRYFFGSMPKPSELLTLIGIEYENNGERSYSGWVDLRNGDRIYRWGLAKPIAPSSIALKDRINHLESISDEIQDMISDFDSDYPDSELHREIWNKYGAFLGDSRDILENIDNYQPTDKKFSQIAHFDLKNRFKKLRNELSKKLEEFAN